MERKIIFSILFALCIASIQIAYAEPEFVFEFGSTGIEDDEFDNPTDVVVDKNGKNIYVVDNKNNRISVFDDDGDYDFQYGSFCDIGIIQNCNDNADGADADGDGQFNNPISIARDALGEFFVVDEDNNRVQIFDDDGEFQSKFGSSNSADNSYLGSAKGIVVQDTTRNIFVSNIDSDSISVFSSAGNFLYKFNSFDGNDNFKNPTNMVIDNSNKMLYVSDSDNDRIIVFELVTGTTCPSGTEESVDGICFVKKFGSSGTANGKFDEPVGLAFDSVNDLLYVAESDNNRIQIFKIIDDTTCPSGTEEIVDGVCFEEKFGSSGTANGQFDTPIGIALDETNGLLFVADSDNDRIQAFDVKSTPSVLLPNSPQNLKASPVSPTSVIISWDEPTMTSNEPAITGYKIEYKIGTGNYIIAEENTASKTTSFIHQGLQAGDYTYRVYSINSNGQSIASSSVTVKPQHTSTPVALTAYAISPNQIKLSWMPPSETFGQAINGYEIKRVITNDVYDTVGNTDGKTTTFIVPNLTTYKTYTFAVSANIGFGSTGESNTASATPRTDSVNVIDDPIKSTSISATKSSPPIKLTATVVSSSQINLAWSAPAEDGNTPITGYKIEMKKDDGVYTTLVADTQSTDKKYSHSNLTINTKYSYRVSAINAVGTSDPSNEFSATPKSTNIKISPIGKLSVDEGKLLSFIVKLVDSSVKDVVFSLEKNPPEGAKIVSNTGMFSWTPTSSDGGKTYTMDIVVKKDGESDRDTITITVNDVLDGIPRVIIEPEIVKVAPFVDETVDPQSYVDRYNNEEAYKKWFDDNYSEYDSIYQAVGLEEPKVLEIAPFVDETVDPQSYVDRYNNEEAYKKWFDDNYSEYDSIYQAVGLEEPKDTPPVITEEPKKEKKYGICGPGTKLIDGVCTIIEKPIAKPAAKPWWKFW